MNTLATMFPLWSVRTRVVSVLRKRRAVSCGSAMLESRDSVTMDRMLSYTREEWKTARTVFVMLVTSSSTNPSSDSSHEGRVTAREYAKKVTDLKDQTRPSVRVRTACGVRPRAAQIVGALRSEGAVPGSSSGGISRKSLVPRMVVIAALNAAASIRFCQMAVLCLALNGSRKTTDSGAAFQIVVSHADVRPWR